MRHAVILAGGSGVRFWPLSRKTRPKQFLPLGGETSLIRATLDRILPLVPAERTWVVTAGDQARRVRRELPELERKRILAEPRARNTAAAVYLAARAIGAGDPDASMVVVPADAWVPRPAPYRRALTTAFRAAEKHGCLVTIGVAPTRVETGYGYIDPGEPLGSGPARRVRRFVEKPSRPRARRFVRGGRHLWNCGVFAWRADAIVDAVRRHLPGLEEAFTGLRFPRPAPARLRAAYERAPSVSVDVGILEPAANVAVVPAAFPWDDLGSWRALERLGRDGSFARGRTVLRDSPGAVVWSEGGVVALVGVPDAIVVHTRDATLVVAKERAQEVRAVVEELERDPGTRSVVER